jgi:hypothetical protein
VGDRGGGPWPGFFQGFSPDLRSFRPAGQRQWKRREAFGTPRATAFDSRMVAGVLENARRGSVTQ